MTALLEARNVTQIFGQGLMTKSRTVALENFSLAIEESPLWWWGLRPNGEAA